MSHHRYRRLDAPPLSAISTGLDLGEDVLSNAEEIAESCETKVIAPDILGQKDRNVAIEVL